MPRCSPNQASSATTGKTKNWGMMTLAMISLESFCRLFSVSPTWITTRRWGAPGSKRNMYATRTGSPCHSASR